MSPASPVQVTLGPGWGWRADVIGDARISFKGYLFDGVKTLEGQDAARHVVRALANLKNEAQINSALSHFAGHFAFLIEMPGRVIASVDRIRSTPLLWGRRDGKIYIDDRGRRLRDKLRLSSSDLDSEQVLACATAGYCVGAGTLYRGLHALRPGEALIVNGDDVRVSRWFVYDAWRTEPMAQPEKQLSQLHRAMMERLAASATGRPIAIPLSGGFDSRLIASGLREVGYKNVKLFSYGRPGNFEAEVAQRVAERLGYPWTFAPVTDAMQRKMFADPSHERSLWEEADNCGSVPFEQDWSAVASLKSNGYLPQDAIIVNGQTGDYITGHHVPSEFALSNVPRDPDARREKIYSRYLRKHHALWGALVTAPVHRRIESLLDAEMAAAGASFDEICELHGIHEFLEYQDRQAKYVVSGQRVYESLGFSWRLPLWDDDYILFWRQAAVTLKARQMLYRKVLLADNWGGVWRDLPVNVKTIRPRWIIPLRLAAKLATAPFGRERWHALERRLFGWWTDNLRISAVVPYWKALTDNREPRHGVAWLTERYLAQHGVSINNLICAKRI